MLIGPKRTGNNSSAIERAIWGDIMALGMFFPVAITAGFFLGSWVGRLFRHPKVGITIGLFLGVATGFFELYRITVRLNSLDKINDANGDRRGPVK
jgi:F0F1-type ATP synthase assembly protein I